MPNIPTSKSSQAVTIIKKLIDEDEWHDYIPSERSLSERLLISRSCLRQALETLTEMGILDTPSKSKRRQILRSKLPPKDTVYPDKKQKVIFLTPDCSDTAPPMMLEQVMKLREYLADSDLFLKVLSSPVFNHENTSFASLETLIKDYPKAYWVLHQCPQHMQKWFDEKAIACCILGTAFPGIQIPSFDYDYRAAARHATGKLIALGHKRIGLVRFRSQLAGDDLALKGITEAIESSKVSDLSPPVVLTHNFHIERLTVALDALYQRASPPTALIVINHHHFLTIYSHLFSRNIQVPQKVSLISLTDHSTLPCLSPRPTCYMNNDRVLKRIANLIINRTTHKAEAVNLIAPELFEGHTIARPGLA